MQKIDSPGAAPKCQEHPETNAEFICLEQKCRHTFFCFDRKCFDLHSRHSLKIVNLKGIQQKLDEPVANSDPAFDQAQQEIQHFYDHYTDQILNNIFLHKEQTLRIVKRYRAEKVPLPQLEQQLMMRASTNIKSCTKQQFVKVLQLCQKDFDPESVSATKTKYLLEQVRQKSKVLNFIEPIRANFQFKCEAFEAMQSLKITPKQYLTITTKLKGYELRNAVPIYNASVQGFNAATFRQRCSQTSETLFIIRSTRGELFGGYNSSNWGGVNNNFSFVIVFGQSQGRFSQPFSQPNIGTNPNFKGGLTWSIKLARDGGGFIQRNVEIIRLFLSSECDKNSDSFFNSSNDEVKSEYTKFRVSNYIVLKIKKEKSALPF